MFFTTTKSKIKVREYFFFFLIMASSDLNISCLNDPNFAVICSFLQKFSNLCNIDYPNIDEMQKMLENTDEGK